MNDNSDQTIIYGVGESVRLFRTDPDAIRFRKGIWSYTEAVIGLHDQDATSKAFFDAMAEYLVQRGVMSVAQICSDLQLPPHDPEVQRCAEVLRMLAAQRFLRIVDTDTTAPSLIDSLMGEGIAGFTARTASRPILFVADTPYAADVAKTMARESNVPIDVMTEALLAEIRGVDLTSKTDAVAHAEALDQLERHFTPYACVVGSFAAPRVSLLRNLNRILVDLEKPLVLGLIDGPFVHVLATASPKTGCFECFEQRMLSRIQDTSVYRQYIESQDRPDAKLSPDPVISASVHMLTAAALSEGFLLSALNMCRVAGRCIGIYLPLLEIQVEDLLRVAYCPACGFIAKSQMTEMYTSSRELVKMVLRNVDLRD